MFCDFAMWSVILMAGALATLNGLKHEVTSALFDDVLEGLGICSRLFTLYYVILLSGWAAGIGVNPVTNTANRSVKDYFADDEAKIQFLVLLTCVPPIKPIGTEFSCLSDLTQPQPRGRYKLQRPVTWECLRTLLTETESSTRYVYNGQNEVVYVRKSVGNVRADGSVRGMPNQEYDVGRRPTNQVMIRYTLEQVSENEWYATRFWIPELRSELNWSAFNSLDVFSDWHQRSKIIDERVREGHVITVGSPESTLPQRYVQTADQVLSRVSDIHRALRDSPGAAGLNM